MSDSDVCKGSESCKMRPTQSMDDSGITWVLGLLSEPSLTPRKERRCGAGGRGQGWGRGRQQAHQLVYRLAFPKGARPLNYSSQPLLCF